MNTKYIIINIVAIILSICSILALLLIKPNGNILSNDNNTIGFFQYTQGEAPSGVDNMVAKIPENTTQDLKDTNDSISLNTVQNNFFSKESVLSSDNKIINDYIVNESKVEFVTGEPFAVSVITQQNNENATEYITRIVYNIEKRVSKGNHQEALNIISQDLNLIKQKYNIEEFDYIRLYTSKESELIKEIKIEHLEKMKYTDETDYEIALSFKISETERISCLISIHYDGDTNQDKIFFAFNRIFYE